MRKLLICTLLLLMLLCLSFSAVAEGFSVPVADTVDELMQVFSDADWSAIGEDFVQAVRSVDVEALLASAEERLAAIDWNELLDDAVDTLRDTDWQALVQSGCTWLEQAWQQFLPAAGAFFAGLGDVLVTLFNEVMQALLPR